MKKISLAVGAAVLAVAAYASSQEFDSCASPGRLASVCRVMKHVRSHIMVLDSQRDLAQLNFAFVEKSLQSLSETVAGLMTTGAAHVHLEKLGLTQKLAEQALLEARARNPNAFRTANYIKTSCQQCHNEGSPAGLKLEDIFQTPFGQPTQRCNEPGKNPFVCKNMYALVASFDAFTTAGNVGRINYEFAAENAREIRRIALTLQSFNSPIHEGGNAPLIDVANRAIELERLATGRSPQVLIKAQEVSRACIQCHRVR
ncbi:MAG TPA: hypothetical protein VFV50_10240 [Bdellovibrionales bacterium]|nr:hypothetical protein [Bdellovibrionales bacterium]